MLGKNQRSSRPQVGHVQLRGGRTSLTFAHNCDLLIDIPSLVA